MSILRSPILSGKLFSHNRTRQLLIGAYSQFDLGLIGEERQEERKKERRVLHALALECTLSGYASVSMLWDLESREMVAQVPVCGFG